ncbi:Ras-related protein RABA5a [Hibiscus syriacus]|uniref:Ras-related protein RABA5a n=1 Tax=Hibiscus syriacus TaxID=106335 RepID=A0A6A2YVR9_HIBSY|nr:Ras-related protein RABA5a [Hibiscus syriacus]
MAFVSEEEKIDEYYFKIVLVGDSAVGKSNLLARLARDEFYPNSKSTIGVEFQTQKSELSLFMTSANDRLLMALAGNKSDLRDAREVSTAEGKALEEAHGLFLIETYTLDSSNIVDAFQTVVKEIYNILCNKVMMSQELKKPESSSFNGKIVVLS